MPTLLGYHLRRAQITVFNDFVKTIDKKADFLDTLRGRIDGRNKFSSVEEKLNDIKARVGFDKITSANKPDIVAEAGCSSEPGKGECSACGAGKECGCGPKGEATNDALMATISDLLRFVREAAKDKPHRPASVIMDECEDSFFVSNIKDFDSDKLKSYIDDHLKLNRKDDSESVEYISYSPNADSETMQNEIAEYYQHGSGETK